MMDWSPVFVSLKTALCATAVTMVFGLLAARWRIRRKGALVEFMDGVLLFPLALPPTVVGLVLLMILGRQSPVDGALESHGLTDIFSWPATVIAATAVAFPIRGITLVDNNPYAGCAVANSRLAASPK